MKTAFRTFAFALLFAFARIACAGSFGAEQIVSTDASMGSQFPEVAYYNGTIHVVWVGYVPGFQGDIFYARATSPNGPFSAPVNLSQSATGSTGNDRPQVSAGPNGVVVGWNSDNNTGATYVRRSGDAGVTFAPTQRVAGAEGDGFYSRITHLFSDSAGRIHLSYYTNADTAGVSGMVHHRMSCDGGVSWSTDTAVTSRTIDGDVDNEEPRLGESGGKVYIVFKSSRNGIPQGGFPPYSIQMQSGTVSGCAATWSYPARRMAGGFPRSYASTFRPEVFGDSGGTLHLAWWDEMQGNNVTYRKGNPAGTMGAISTVSNFGVDHLEPGGLASTAATAAGGFQVPPGLTGNGTSAFISYQRNSAVSSTVAGYEYGPVYLRESTDNGTTWGAEQLIATTSQATTPHIAVGGSGSQNVAVVWSDVRSSTARIYYRPYTGGPVSGPSFALNPDPASFASRVVSTTSAATNVTLSNNGTTSATITAIAVSGDFAKTATTCGASLAVGASCTITVNFTPTALGARAGSITVTGNAVNSPATSQLTGTGTASTSFAANVNAVITGYYETILGRSPDAGGLTFWSGETTRVTGLGADVREVFFAMAVQFFNSAEYLNRNTTDTQYITDLYRTFFLRSPDAGGLAFWLPQLSGGMDRGAMLNNFLFSTEYSTQMTSLFGSANPRPEINMTIDLYRGILGVLPDSSGFSFWLGQIRTAQCQGSAAVASSVGSLAQLFISSAQYAQREAARPPSQVNAMHIGDLYNAFLRRGGDLSGYLFWVSQLNTGAQSRDQVRQAFIASPEFQARVNAVVAAGCLP